MCKLIIFRVRKVLPHVGWVGYNYRRLTFESAGTVP
jgi:hypothetical protein